MPDPNLKLTSYEREYCTPATQSGLLLIRSCSDEQILAAARDDSSPEHKSLHLIMGESTNPYWITATCAETAYERGVMSPEEMDWITR